MSFMDMHIWSKSARPVTQDGGLQERREGHEITAGQIIL
jgi:hypothetical protein